MKPAPLLPCIVLAALALGPWAGTAKAQADAGAQAVPPPPPLRPSAAPT